MGLVKTFIKFLSDVKPVQTLADLEEGRAGAEGIIRIGEEGDLVSPVRGLHCLAFFYNAYHFVSTRSGQMMPSKLRVAEVYYPFDLELPDGRIKAIPKKTDTFTAADHKELSGVGYENFKAIEDIVSAGTRVRLFGTAKKEGERWVLRFNKLEVVTAMSEGDTLSVPKKKSKKKKSKRI